MLFAGENDNIFSLIRKMVTVPWLPPTPTWRIELVAGVKKPTPLKTAVAATKAGCLAIAERAAECCRRHGAYPWDSCYFAPPESETGLSDLKGQ